MSKNRMLIKFRLIKSKPKIFNDIHFKIVNFQRVQKLLQCLKAAAPSAVSFKVAAHFDSMCQWGRCANKVSNHRHIVGEVVNAEQVRVFKHFANN